MGEYTDVHRVVLQGLMSKGILSSSEFRTLVRNTVGRFSPEKAEEMKDSKILNNTIHKLVGDITEKLLELSLKIKKGVSEEHFNKKETFYVLTNINDTRSGLIAQRCNFFLEAKEVEYFKALIASIMQNHPGRQIDVTSAVNLGSDVSMSIRQAENVVKKLIDLDWLSYANNKRHLRFSVRFICEMTAYLKAVHPDDYFECKQCCNPVIRYIECKRSECDKKFHLYCLGIMYGKKGRNMPEKMLCPACKKYEINLIRQTTEVFSDDSDSSDDNDDVVVSQASGNKRKHSSQGRPILSDESSDDD